MNVVHFGRFEGMRELALFAGAGGGILGGKMLGWRTVCAVEIEPYPRACLLQRQRDRILEPFPIWDDVCTFDGKPWRGLVDVISGGFPCQDISSAGKGLGIERGERSGLWREYARIIREIRPRYCFVENSPMLTTRGLGIVLGDLAEIGYDAAWRVLSAEDCGAPHQRDRMWIVAKAPDATMPRRARGLPVGENAPQSMPRVSGSEMADAVRNGSEARIADSASGKERQSDKPNNYGGVGGPEVCDTASDRLPLGKREEVSISERSDLQYKWGTRWWQTESGLGRVADGVANRVDRLKAIGNGQVSLVAARAFSELYEQLNED